MRHDDWRKLTLRHKIGQTMLMLPDRKRELELGGGSLNAFFGRYPVCGFFMGWKLFEGVAPQDQVAHICRATQEYQDASSLPLVFQQDYECGVTLPGMTGFPRPMSMGAANSEALAYDYGRSIALESRSVGVKWVLHPVADLNVNPQNPITNVRSVSDDPAKAIRLLSRQIAGLQENGVAATIKHFPGDGVDSRDQHLTTTCNSLSREQWHQQHGLVFQTLIDQGVAAIMPGHITLPAYQAKKLGGFYPPATLSSELLTDLLKGQMRFRGVIISDAMTMGGFRGYYPSALESEIQCFAAGVDVLLWPSYEFMDELERRITRGDIPMSRLDDAVERAWALKQRFGLLEEQVELIRPLAEEDHRRAQATATGISERALTLLRDRTHALPLDPQKDKRILLVGVAPHGRQSGDGEWDRMAHLQQLLQARGFTVDLQRNILYECQGWDSDAPEHYDRLIFVYARAPHNPFGPLQVWDDEAQTTWAVNALPKDKIIVISLGSPYTISEYFDRVHTCINGYSNDDATHEALVKALMGELPFKGESPVALP